MLDQFKEHCEAYRVMVGIRAFPNPGSPYEPMRVLSFRNFTNALIHVQRLDKKARKYVLPANGTLEIMIAPSEPYPQLSKEG